ncbi:MAG: sulfatase [Dehalococcoidia bacterium]|nr:sulfatase [Dehalococcoidia bacterium]
MPALAACNSPRRVEPFADYVPVQQFSVSTDVIDPASPTSDDFLGRGWAPRAETSAATDGRAIDDSWASFRFYVATAGAARLEIEVGPDPAVPPQEQVLRLEVNDRRVGRVTLEPGWNTYALRMPARALEIGWNRAELRFRRTAPPAGQQLEGADRRRPAGHVRRLRVRSSLDRPLWSDRPPVIRATSEAPESARIEMPADSLFDVYMELPPQARLVGSIDAVAVDRSPGAASLRAAVELLDEAGRTETLIERSFEGEGDNTGPERFQIDLDRWQDSIVRFRLRSWGNANGIIQWRDVSIEAPGSDDNATADRSGQLLSPPRSGRLGRPHVVVVLVDTGRADAFDGSRPDRPTPAVEALAADGTRFTQAWSPSGWTGESVPGLATGWYPEATGTDDWRSQIPLSVPTLAELMSRAGYFTFLWSQHRIWEGNASFSRGFESLGEGRADRDLLPGAADLFVEGRPTFAMVHLLPPHTPYTPPDPFRGSLTADYEAARGLGGSAEEIVNPADEMHSTWPDGTPTPDDLAYVRARYDENVRYSDHLVGRILDGIRRAGQYDNTLIVFLSDHGEAFYEHGLFLHGDYVYEENIWVPFVVKWPASVREFPRTVVDPVSLLDLVPTLVDGLDLPADGAVFHGRSLLPPVFDGADATRDLFLSRRPLMRESARVYAFRSGRYKFIYNGRAETTELYDLVDDPTERVDLAARFPFRARLLLQRVLLQRHHNLIALADAGGARRSPLDGDTQRALEALGYVR